ncbi:unnamed protein product [Caenorhabditis sp. 36 PRJEB53466]|nr:unnamed protein product [Caenorhabditis sp. 36 PRJEB53466]
MCKVLFFTVILLAFALFVAESSAQSQKSLRRCGLHLIKALQSFCGGPCTADNSQDIAIRACTQPHTKEELMMLCCPDAL